jgi:hypothetical protein
MTLILNRSMNLRHYLPDLRDLPDLPDLPHLPDRATASPAAEPVLADPSPASRS